MHEDERLQKQVEESAAAAAASAPVLVGDRLFVVAAPTPDEELFIRRELRRQCLASLKSPLQKIADDVRGLPLPLAEIAVRAAVELQAGSDTGKAEPTEDMLIDRLYTPEGCAFRLWVLARREEPGLALKDVQALVTEANVLEVVTRLLDALQAADEKKAAASGASGPST